MTDAQLLPCPFCGSAARTVGYYRRYGGDAGLLGKDDDVRCSNHDCTLGAWSTPVAKWNRRAALDVTAGERDFGMRESEFGRRILERLGFAVDGNGHRLKWVAQELDAYRAQLLRTPPALSDDALAFALFRADFGPLDGWTEEHYRRAWDERAAVPETGGTFVERWMTMARRLRGVVAAPDPAVTEAMVEAAAALSTTGRKDDPKYRAKILRILEAAFAASAQRAGEK